MSSHELPAAWHSEAPSSDTLHPSSPIRLPLQDHQVLTPSSETAPSSDTPLNPEQPEHEPEPEPEPEPENPRVKALNAKRTILARRLKALQTERDALIAQSTLPSGLPFPSEWTEEQKSKQALVTANAVIKEHISLLHGYNEIKDIGQGLLGLVADKRGMRVKDLMEEFGVGIND